MHSIKHTPLSLCSIKGKVGEHVLVYFDYLDMSQSLVFPVLQYYSYSTAVRHKTREVESLVTGLHWLPAYCTL